MLLQKLRHSRFVTLFHHLFSLMMFVKLDGGISKVTVINFTTADLVYDLEVPTMMKWALKGPWRLIGEPIWQLKNTTLDLASS